MRQNPVKMLLEHGQSPWLELIDRRLIRSGELERMIGEWALRGIASNPSILARSITQSREYDADIATLAKEGCDAEKIYQAVVVGDARSAAELLQGVYERTGGVDGFVSVPISPRSAGDAGEMIGAAKRLRSAIGRPNVMIAVPATAEGLTALRALLAEGVSVQATLLFSLRRYRDVLSAYLEGMEAAEVAGRKLEKIMSAACFFLSPIDRAVDRELDRIAAEDEPRAEAAAALSGKAAIACARRAYAAFEELVASPRFRRLARRGAVPQRPLWASAAPEDSAFSDTKYVEALIGPQTISAMPPAMLEAFHRHGNPRRRLPGRAEEAAATLAALGRVGVDVDRIATGLLRDGLRSFVESHDSLLEILEIARQSVLGASGDGAR